MKIAQYCIYIAGIGVCLLIGTNLTKVAKESNKYNDPQYVPDPSPEITTVAPVTPPSPRAGEVILLSLCPPKTVKPFKNKKNNLLIVSTLDGQ